MSLQDTPTRNRNEKTVPEKNFGGQKIFSGPAKVIHSRDERIENLMKKPVFRFKSQPRLSGTTAATTTSTTATTTAAASTTKTSTVAGLMTIATVKLSANSATKAKIQKFIFSPKKIGN